MDKWGVLFCEYLHNPWPDTRNFCYGPLIYTMYFGFHQKFDCSTICIWGEIGVWKKAHFSHFAHLYLHEEVSNFNKLCCETNLQCMSISYHKEFSAIGQEFVEISWEMCVLLHFTCMCAGKNAKEPPGRDFFPKITSCPQHIRSPTVRGALWAWGQCEGIAEYRWIREGSKNHHFFNSRPANINTYAHSGHAQALYAPWFNTQNNSEWNPSESREVAYENVCKSAEYAKLHNFHTVFTRTFPNRGDGLPNFDRSVSIRYCKWNNKTEWE